MSLKKNQYIFNPFWVKLVYGFGLLSWFAILYKYLTFFNSDFLYGLFLLPFMFVLIACNILNYELMFFCQKFDLKKHEKFKKQFWKNLKKYPNIDIYLPVCGENIKVLENTWKNIKKIIYPNNKLNIYVLDDGGNNETKLLASKYHFHYLSRPNKGEMKKAGNLLYAFNRTKGDFYIVFDADFVPQKNFIKELLPYMSNPKNAIVQSPQYFKTTKEIYKKSMIEYGAAILQENFYKIVQNSRNFFGAALCVGSNAIYRRSAVKQIGGPPQVDHGEDVYIGLKLISSFFEVKYIPLILATGLCPDNMITFFQQHNRWCSSSIGMLMSNIVLKAKISLGKKICYYNGFLCYIYELFYLLLPIEIFILLIKHQNYIQNQSAIFFIPLIIFELILLPLLIRSKFGVKIAIINSIYTDSYTTVLRLIGKPATWVPTNTKVNKIPKSFSNIFIFNFLYVFLLLLLILILIYNRKLPIINLGFFLIAFYFFWTSFVHSSFLWLSFLDISKILKTKFNKYLFCICFAFLLFLSTLFIFLLNTF